MFRMFLQINLDTIRRWHDGRMTTVERKDSEYQLGPLLHQAYEKKPFEKVYVLNGPGSFTNLRLGCLALNVLAHLIPQQVTFYDCSKLNFWKVCHEHGAVPQTGILFIGQKRNAWLTTIPTQSTEKISLLTLAEMKEEYFVESINGWEEGAIAHLHVVDEHCVIRFNGKETTISLDQFPWEEKDAITPHYVIGANVSKSSKPLSFQ